MRSGVAESAVLEVHRRPHPERGVAAAVVEDLDELEDLAELTLRQVRVSPWTTGIETSAADVTIARPMHDRAPSLAQSVRVLVDEAAVSGIDSRMGHLGRLRPDHRHDSRPVRARRKDGRSRAPSDRNCDRAHGPRTRAIRMHHRASRSRRSPAPSRDRVGCSITTPSYTKPCPGSSPAPRSGSRSVCSTACGTPGGLRVAASAAPVEGRHAHPPTSRFRMINRRIKTAILLTAALAGTVITLAEGEPKDLPGIALGTPVLLHVERIVLVVALVEPATAVGLGEAALVVLPHRADA